MFMGGPMSVNDEQELPYLKEEKVLIRDAVRQGRPVLGICLGAQLIASAFGARVYPYIQETGWHRLMREPVTEGIFSAFPEQFHVFQFHGETFDLPAGARLLCTGDSREKPGVLLQNRPRAPVSPRTHRYDHPGMDTGHGRRDKRYDPKRNSPLHRGEQPALPGDRRGIHHKIRMMIV